MPCTEVRHSRRRSRKRDQPCPPPVWQGEKNHVSPTPTSTTEPCSWDAFSQPGLHFPGSPASRWGHVTSSCSWDGSEGGACDISLLRWLESRCTDVSILSSSTCWPTRLGSRRLRGPRGRQSHRVEEPLKVSCSQDTALHGCLMRNKTMALNHLTVWFTWHSECRLTNRSGFRKDTLITRHWDPNPFEH